MDPILELEIKLGYNCLVFVVSNTQQRLLFKTPYQ